MSQAEIAELIQEHIDNLVTVWAKTVRADESIKSDADLSDGGLVNHIPVMLEEICAVLRSGRTPTISTINEARVHAYTRFCQGYRARDLIRETTLLRMTLLEFISSRLLADYRQHSVKSLLEVLRTINLYIDEELRYAVAIYTEEKKGRHR
jgi:hypothetical protein